VAHERPGFEGSEVVSETIAEATGTFVLATTDVRAGDVLVAEGPLHASLRMPMPSGGELRVTLVARRRALLERLVAWARRRGAPFDLSPDPTPEHVRRVAFAGQSPDVMRGGGDRDADNVRIQAWAGAVERAAYGGEPIDARREAEVDELAPDRPRPDVSGGRGPGPRAR
jgi:hypothetical protein